MRVAARAPGKLAVLGEYAVLDGAPALVLAVDRLASAAVGPSPDGLCRLSTRFPAERRAAVAPGSRTGFPLADLVLLGEPAESAAPGPWAAELDSSAFYLGDTKLGLGSSAAALCALAAAWAAWRGLSAPTVEGLVALHRQFQGGAGSGLDVAASLTGGAIEYRLDADSTPRVGSVRMPNSVGFASIFAGRSASTPDFVARYHGWRAERPVEAEEQQRIMTSIAEAGCAAVREGDGSELLRAVERYGRQLERLGQVIGAEIVTPEHRAIGAVARRFGISYKVSGAGGGDLGLGIGDDPDALAAFARAAAAEGYLAVNLHLAPRGLIVEELTE